MPLIGCSGDLNHFDVTVPGMQTEPAEAKRIGHAYATAVICGDLRFELIETGRTGIFLSFQRI